jgi:hypothetical protein
VRLGQDVETPVRVEESERFRWRYAYARCEESRHAGEPGQDYVAFDQAPAWFAFALCDGVGQSFFGNIGAQILGEHLLEFLTRCLPGSNQYTLAETVTAELRELTRPGTRLIQAYSLPTDTSRMLADVLREKRDNGSESMFVCGRIDAPTPGLPDGRIALIWSGDSRLRLWGPHGERTSELGPTFSTAERWSTRIGLVHGQAHVFLAPLRATDGCLSVTHVLAYSDGLAMLDTRGASPSDGVLIESMEAARSTAANDDMSLIEVWLRPDP